MRFKEYYFSVDLRFAKITDIIIVCDNKDLPHTSLEKDNSVFDIKKNTVIACPFYDF